MPQTTSQFLDHELATVLAALRFWQSAIERDADLSAWAEHFAEFTPLSSHEIDELCERINHN